MRVMLVSANREQIPDPIFPLGLAYIAAAIRLSGHRELIETIRAVSDAIVVLGGSGFSILPAAYMEALGADWGIRGEGEQAFVQLLDALEQGRNPGAIPSVVSAPGETPRSIRATCDALKRMQPTAVVAMTGVRLYPGTPLTESLIERGCIHRSNVGLLPTFYIDPAVEHFLPGYLQQQALEAGNWVLPGLAAPLLPHSQRLLRGLGISGPMWRLLNKPWMKILNRSRFRQPSTSWGVPNQKRKVI